MNFDPLRALTNATDRMHIDVGSERAAELNSQMVAGWLGHDAPSGTRVTAVRSFGRTFRSCDCSVSIDSRNHLLATMTEYLVLLLSGHVDEDGRIRKDIGPVSAISIPVDQSNRKKVLAFIRAYWGVAEFRKTDDQVTDEYESLGMLFRCAYARRMFTLEIELRLVDPKEPTV